MDQGKILHQGIAQGTDPFGRLRVMTETGEIPVLVGDVSIRPAHPFKGTP
jgi:BirA family biotin operon repressor/biotin-[acetyl-CoA-carboxylase] ligase